MSITNLVIAGAGGFGREVFSWVSDQIKHDSRFKIVGFIDDTLPKLNHYPPVISTIADYIPKENEKVIIALGSPESKKNVGISLLEKKTSFFSVIHPSVQINQNTHIDIGCILCPYVIISNESVLNSFVTINSMSTIGHDVAIGSWSVISGHCDITGGTHVGESVFFGSRSGTVPKINIGNGVTVGAGSTVIHSVPDYETVFGMPARKIK